MLETYTYSRSRKGLSDLTIMRCISLQPRIDVMATCLSFTCYLLAEHPEVQDKVRKEVNHLRTDEVSLMCHARPVHSVLLCEGKILLLVS